ncbi:ABC transporter substrate-binding protein [Actinomadura chibensis]|uniref:PhnD/SsuA/transferrin family substrate-binding protein n=1 Tax=Actinomadura chibensis TaxID=392828 RepID=A0A5D0NC74_9ACTN|nr:NrtA/SsuA/CpmA family ABC transporter substrate-binding protein [Actinomadura chibensis]TYB41861.1 PhnD/SsuA/transferrin family substrate-binding protein [Actinomadura chibensis]
MIKSGVLRARRLLAVVTAAALAVTGCAADGPPGSGAAGKDLTQVRVAFNPGTATRLYAALAHGLFEKHGLDVKLVQFENGAATNAAFASGGVDVGYSGIPGILASRLSSDTRVFMVDNDGADAGGLVVTKKSGISGIEDLRGKKIGTVIGTTAWMALISALKAKGIDPSEVKIENVGPTAWIPAFNKGNVDGVWGWAPLIFQMDDSGGEIVATDSAYLRNPLLWQVRGKFLGEHPKAVSSFVAAYDEASAFVGKGDKEFLARMQKMTGADEPLVKRTVEALKPVEVKETASEGSPYSMTSPKGLEAIIGSWADVLVQHKILQKRPELAGLVDPAPIKQYLGE